jgi:hypothetical protein
LSGEKRIVRGDSFFAGRLWISDDALRGVALHQTLPTTSAEPTNAAPALKAVSLPNGRASRLTDLPAAGDDALRRRDRWEPEITEQFARQTRKATTNPMKTRHDVNS